jgi:hypothetical protein
MINRSITTAIQRLQHYLFENGIMELQVGLLLFALGLFFLPLPMSILTQGLLQFMSLIIFIAALFLGDFLRAKYVYSRSGFAGNDLRLDTRLLKKISPVFILFILLAFLIILPVLLIRSDTIGDRGLSWTVFGVEMFFSVLFLFVAIQAHISRLFLAAGLMAMLAVLFSPLVFEKAKYILSNSRTPYWVISPSQAILTGFSLSFGLILCVSGVIGLANYLRTNFPGEDSNGYR